MTRGASVETRIGLPLLLNYTQGISVGIPHTRDFLNSLFKDKPIMPRTCSKKQLSVLGVGLGHGYKPVKDETKAKKIEEKLARQVAKYDENTPGFSCIPFISRSHPALIRSEISDMKLHKKKYGIPLLLKKTELTEDC